MIALIALIAAALTPTAPAAAAVPSVATQAYAWPSGESLAALHDGDAVPLVPLATQQSGSGARFVVRPTGLPANYVDESGRANLEWRVDDGSGGQFVRFGPGTLGGLIVLGDTATTAGPGAGFGQFAAAVVPMKGTPCSWIAMSQYKEPYEQYVQANGFINAPAGIDEKLNSSHELGIAFSAKGSSWSANGSATIKITGGGQSTEPRRSTSQVWSNTVRYREFAHVCGSKTLGYQWRPVATLGLNTRLDIVPAPHYTAKCVNQYAGSTFYKTTGQANTITTGVTLDVVTLSAKADYGTDVTISWAPTADVQYCSYDDQGPVKSALVDVHS